MISKRFIQEVSKNPFLTDKEKFQIYLNKVSSQAQESRKKYPCPKCGEYASHLVTRSTYTKRLCAICGTSFDKRQRLEYSRRYYDYKGNRANPN